MVALDDYSLKWKKISDGEFDVFAASPDGKTTIFLGQAVYNVSKKKWHIKTDYKHAGMPDDLHLAYNDYPNEIEAGRALKKIWIASNNYIKFQKKFSKSIPSYDSEYDLTDEDWEKIIADFSLDGD